MILCLGTTPTLARTMTFAKLTLDAVNRTADVVEYASGKAANVARAAATMGAGSLCMGFVGGTRGQLFLDGLNAERLRHAMLSVAAPTRLCITVVDNTSRHATELVEEAHAVTHTDGEALLSLLESKLAGASALVISGALTRGLTIDFTARCVALAREKGLRTIVDGSGEALRHALPERPSVVKINADELAGVAGAGPMTDESTCLEEMRRLSQVTGGWWVVTRGRHPTLATNGREALRAMPPVITNVVNPIGSGDSFAAGIAVAGERGLSMTDALQLATGMAAANVETALAAKFERDRAEGLSQEVRVGPVGAEA